MKFLKVLISVILAAAMMVIPALATEFVPSIEVKDGIQIVDFEQQDPDDTCDITCDTLLVIPYVHITYDAFLDEIELDITADISEEMEEQIRQSLKAAYEELKNNPVQDITEGFEEAWNEATGGAPYDNIVVTDIFEIVLICGIDDILKTDSKITIEFTVKGIDADDDFIIIHKPTGSDKWIVEEYTIDEDGVITMTVDKLSPFAIVADSGKKPSSDIDSPQTGVADYTVYAVVASIIFVGLGIACVRKSRKVSAK